MEWMQAKWCKAFSMEEKRGMIISHSTKKTGAPMFLLISLLSQREPLWDLSQEVLGFPESTAFHQDSFSSIMRMELKLSLARLINFTIINRTSILSLI